MTNKSTTPGYMVTSLFKIDQLLSHLDKGTRVLTPNNRLRNKIAQAYGQHCSLAQKNTGISPALFAFSEWAQELWQQLLDAAYPGCRGAIASSTQRQYLWQQVIRNSELGGQLLRPEQLASTADGAYRNLELWNLSIQDVEAVGDIDSAPFVEWAQAFENALKRHSLITQEQAYQVIAHAFEQGVLTKEDEVVLQSFDDIPPLQRALLESAAVGITEIPAPGVESVNQRVTLASQEEEIRAAARWSQHILRQQPDATVGIIVPDLGQCRSLVERLFVEVFEAGFILPGQPRYTLPFNFSAGIPLASTPLVFDSLQLLRLNLRQWQPDPLKNLLYSPFWGDSAVERPLRARLADRLDKLEKLHISTTDLRYQAEKLAQGDPTTAHELSKNLQQFEALRRQALRQNTASAWAQLFQEQLESLHWPGTRRLDSNEYQQVNQWYQLLARFSELDATGCLLSLNEALQELQSLASSTHYQAQTPESPIQILGALEGAGLQFSHCWVMGLHRRDWPPVPAPNPLLPLSLQREHDMPHASVERELGFAQSLTDGYRRCAPNVIFSSPDYDGEAPLFPSPLITDIPEIPFNALTAVEEGEPNGTEELDQFYQRLQAKAPDLILVDCSQGPPLALSPGENAPGGSAILQQQAACPFNAFASFRLGAREAREASLGLSAIERGIILHEALSLIWKKLERSENLIALGEEELLEEIHQAVTSSLEPWQKRRASELSPYYCQLESERLCGLIQNWLALEKERPAFNVIAVESSSNVLFAELGLELRIDRIDQLENGELLLIDYKTGEPNINRWQGERPQEPQLPLYALCLDQVLDNQFFDNSSLPTVGAVSFAQINAKAIKFQGVGQFNETTPAIDGITPPDQLRYSQLPSEWPAIINYWSNNLERLAHAFRQGESAVDFRDASAQRYSEALTPLNRHLEQSALANYIDTHQQGGSR